MEILDLRADYVAPDYIIAVILSTAYVLNRLIVAPSRTEKTLISIIVAIALGVVWYHFMHIEPNALVISFLLSVVTYEWKAQELLKQWGIGNYNNGKGVL
jgi:dolichyl-phosphate-mannose--protein O-mannosyl transferase